MREAIPCGCVPHGRARQSLPDRGRNATNNSKRRVAIRKVVVGPSDGVVDSRGRMVVQPRGATHDSLFVLTGIVGDNLFFKGGTIIIL